MFVLLLDSQLVRGQHYALYYFHLLLILSQHLLYFFLYLLKFFFFFKSFFYKSSLFIFLKIFDSYSGIGFGREASFPDKSVSKLTHSKDAPLSSGNFFQAGLEKSDNNFCCNPLGLNLNSHR